MPAIDVVGHQQGADHELELVRRSACSLRRLAGVRGARRGEKPSEDMRWARGKTRHGGVYCGWGGASGLNDLKTIHVDGIPAAHVRRQWVERLGRAGLLLDAGGAL